MTTVSIAEAMQRATAAEATYRCRPSVASAEISWRLTAHELVRDGANPRSIPYADIRRIRIFGSPGMAYNGSNLTPPSDICRLKLKSGRDVTLTSTHILGLGRSEDRSASFWPFVDKLVRHAKRANPAVVLVSGMPPALWALWAAVVTAAAATAVLASGMTIYAMSTIGAALWSGDHHRLRLDTFVTGGLALIMAVSIGVSVPVLTRTLWHQWPRRTEWRGQ
jgi:hypothetical protein